MAALGRGQCSHCELTFMMVKHAQSRGFSGMSQATQEALSHAVDGRFTHPAGWDLPPWLESAWVSFVLGMPGQMSRLVVACISAVPYQSALRCWYCSTAPACYYGALGTTVCSATAHNGATGLLQQLRHGNTPCSHTGRSHTRCHAPLPSQVWDEVAGRCEEAQDWPFLRTGVPPRAGQRLYMTVSIQLAQLANSRTWLPEMNVVVAAETEAVPVQCVGPPCLVSRPPPARLASARPPCKHPPASCASLPARLMRPLPLFALACCTCR